MSTEPHVCFTRKRWEKSNWRNEREKERKVHGTVTILLKRWNSRTATLTRVNLSCHLQASKLTTTRDPLIVFERIRVTVKHGGHLRLDKPTLSNCICMVNPLSPSAKESISNQLQASPRSPRIMQMTRVHAIPTEISVAIRNFPIFRSIYRYRSFSQLFYFYCFR